MKKRIFKVIRPQQHFEKPKPIVILDRNRHTEELEKAKKLEEENMVKLQQEKEEAQEVAAKINQSIQTQEVILNSINNTKQETPSIKQDMEFLNKKQKAREELNLKERAQLDTLLDKLNKKSELISEVKIKEETEYHIPYYLTKEWVTKNLLK